VEDGVLTMTEGEGAPFRARGGEKITHRLQRGEDTVPIAKRLTLRIRRSVCGNMDGFHRVLSYRPLGIT
jgi:hypothetical protein